MRILLTNDDGVDAPGIAALRRAIGGFGPVTVVAPSEGLSGCGHRVTTELALKLNPRGDDVFSLDGTPADCVRVGVHSACPRVDWVFSGINAGGNLGVDLFISGTVAAVREGAIHGIPGIAFSQYRRRNLAVDWDLASRLAEMVAGQLLQLPVLPGEYWNVNFPHLDPGTPIPEVVFCDPNALPLPLSFRMEGNHFHYSGDYHSRRHAPGTDVEACFGGKIAISKLRVF